MLDGVLGYDVSGPTCFFLTSVSLRAAVPVARRIAVTKQFATVPAPYVSTWTGRPDRSETQVKTCQIAAGRIHYWMDGDLVDAGELQAAIRPSRAVAAQHGILPPLNTSPLPSDAIRFLFQPEVRTASSGVRPDDSRCDPS